MSDYLKQRQMIAQGLITKENKKPTTKRTLLNPGGEKTLDEWFQGVRALMTGKCRHCQGASCKYNDMQYKSSIAHLLPKKLFPSVATHPDNWIELCHWNNNCHAKMDAQILDMTDMHCWDEIVEKFICIYPAIDPKERRNIPDVLLQYAKDSI